MTPFDRRVLAMLTSAEAAMAAYRRAPSAETAGVLGGHAVGMAGLCAYRSGVSLQQAIVDLAVFYGDAERVADELRAAN